MDALLESIRIAVATDASDEHRAAGAQACRTILLALDAKAGEPLAAPSIPASPVALIATAMRSMPAEQLLDLAISRLRAALPADATAAPTNSLRFNLLPLPVVKP